MKQILSIALILAVMLGCGACAASQPGLPETVTELQDGSYLISTVEQKAVQQEPEKCLGFVMLAGQEKSVEIVLSSDAIRADAQTPVLTDDMLTDMNEIIGNASTLTYPVLEKQPDGSFSVMTVDAYGNPVSTDGMTVRVSALMGHGWDLDASTTAAMEHYPAYPTLRKLPDGTYTVVMLNRNGQPIQRTKTATKVSRFYSADGKLQWTMEVTATFTYDGYSVSCTDVSGTVTIADTNSWYLIEQTTGEDRAVYGVTFGRVTLGVTTSTPDFVLEISCDSAGNLS